MPKAIPPPPPQASAEETVIAVRHVRRFVVLALMLYLGLASLVQPDSFFVNYGRENGASWNLWKLRHMEESKERAHDGGRIVWLVGSSMLRDSFNAKTLNRVLAERESEFRVVKFGQSRGATGLSRGILQNLPIREGDLVVHGMGVENLHKDWVEYSMLPDWRIMLMNRTDQIWDIESWGVQKKLEASVAVPSSFFMYQEEAMAGWIHWVNAPFYLETPKLPKGHRHLRYRARQKISRADKMVESSEQFRNHMRSGDLDLSATQYNLKGLADFRRIVEDAGAELVLFEHTGRQQYRDIYIDDELEAEWDRWWEEQAEVIELPTLSEGSFYDMKHPNRKGRTLLTAYLSDWLSHRWDRPPVDWVTDWERRKAVEGDVLNKSPEEVAP
jgi:predicted phosphohydrolase